MDKHPSISARAYVVKSNSFTFLLAKILVNNKFFEPFCCWYAYFRWVDDIADASVQGIQSRLLFLNNEIDLVNKLYSQDIEREGLSFNEYLEILVSFDLDHKSILKKYIIDLLKCIKFDIERIDTIKTKSELTLYFEIETLSYLNTFQFFLNPNAFVELTDSPEGLSGKWIHILRDLIDDLEEGIINVPSEAINKYSISIKEPSEQILLKQLTPWVKEIILLAGNGFYTGKRNLQNNTNLKYKILVIILCSKYELYLSNIKNSHYHLKRKYSFTLSQKLRQGMILIFQIAYMCIYHFFRKKSVKVK